MTKTKIYLPKADSGKIEKLLDTSDEFAEGRFADLFLRAVDHEDMRDWVREATKTAVFFSDSAQINLLKENEAISNFATNRLLFVGIMVGAIIINELIGDEMKGR